jgi:hypothetical protein
LLDSLLKTKETDAHVVHALKHKDNKIVYIELEDFLFGKTRRLISDHIEKGTAEACVTHISAITCDRPDTPITSKRLALLSKIDLNAHEKLTSMQKGYTHVLHLANVSCFHNTLLKFGIRPLPEADDSTRDTE